MSTSALLTSADGGWRLGSTQGYAPTHAQSQCLARITGEQLIGAALVAPLASYAKVYVLPMLTISMTKGTGVGASRRGAQSWAR